jgi:hypothetical protein
MNSRILYALAAVAVFVVEVGIALFMHDALIRPYGGDALAVVLVYLAVRAGTPLGPKAAILLALAVAVGVELAQLANLLDLLGLRGNRLARTVLGGAFDLKDFAAYGLGAIGILIIEKVRRPRPV